MARDWKTTYVASTAAAQHTVTLPSAAVAGHTLVALAAAPATIQLPAGWTPVADPIGSGELDAGFKVAVGGETSLLWDRESGQAVAPRGLAGWVESRDDLGGLHAGTILQYPSTFSAGVPLTLDPMTTSVAGCRIYLAVSTVQEVPWPIAVSSQLTIEDTVTVTGLGSEPVRMTVASGVVAAGTHTLTISGVPAGVGVQIVAWAMEPGGSTPPPEPPAAETIIEAENRLTGVAKSTWDIVGAGSMTIQGYATATSVDRGQALSLKVHSPSSAWTGTVYRLGYYGGAGARQITTISGPQTTQPAGTIDPTTLMPSLANWTVNGSWTPAADAVPGMYLIKLTRNDNTALASHIGPFVVHNPARKAPITVKISDSTWQAYNHCGTDPADLLNGRNIYGTGTSSSFVFNPSTRARATSYDRPVVTRQHIPQTAWMNAEYPLWRWLERLGYDVDYLSCAQVDADPTLLLGREVVISSGHDEYWSAGMRDAFIGARDHVSQSSHAIYLSGNEAFWRIRFDSARRTFACWKDTLDGSLNSTGAYSGTWQDTRSFNPDRRPAALLDGQRFRLNGISAYAMAATSTHASSPLWRSTAVAALTGSQTWTSAVGIVGFEADEPADMIPSEAPAGLIRLSQATYTVNDMLSDDDGNIYTLDGSYTHAITGYRSATTGAAVFGFGTVQYAWGLDETHDRHPGGTIASPVLQQALTNLLADLGNVPPAYPFPAGLTLPTPVALSTYGLPDPALDTTPPAAPTGLQATPGQTQIALTWTASSDNVAVTGYDVLRNGTPVATNLSGLAYTFTGLTAGTGYTLGVRARDAAGNVSTLATTTATTTTPEPGDPGEPAGELFTATELTDFLQQGPLAAASVAVAHRVAAGWLRNATGLTVWPDPVPDDLWAWALELAGLAYNNPEALAADASGSSSSTWDRQRRAQILADARRAYASPARSGGPVGYFPPPSLHWC